MSLTYATAVNYDITLAGLASSSTLLAGQQSTAISRGSAIDALITGKIMTGTNPVANTSIEVLAIGAKDHLPTWPAPFGGLDAARTIESANKKGVITRPVATIRVDTDSDRTYDFGPVSLRLLFGLIPAHHILFVTHDTGALLNGTGTNHQIQYQLVTSP